MKKVLAILLAIAMIAAMAACAQKAAPADETKTSGETTSTAGETVDNTADDTADTASSESYKIFLITMDQIGPTSTPAARRRQKSSGTWSTSGPRPT